jgi:hypothetical protein
MEVEFHDFSERALISREKHLDFDSAIPRFESWRPSQIKALNKKRYLAALFGALSSFRNSFRASRTRARPRLQACRERGTGRRPSVPRAQPARDRVHARAVHDPASHVLPPTPSSTIVTGRFLVPTGNFLRSHNANWNWKTACSRIRRSRPPTLRKFNLDIGARSVRCLRPLAVDVGELLKSLPPASSGACFRRIIFARPGFRPDGFTKMNQQKAISVNSKSVRPCSFPQTGRFYANAWAVQFCAGK